MIPETERKFQIWSIWPQKFDTGTLREKRLSQWNRYRNHAYLGTSIEFQSPSPVNFFRIDTWNLSNTWAYKHLGI